MADDPFNGLSNMYGSKEDAEKVAFNNKLKSAAEAAQSQTGPISLDSASGSYPTYSPPKLLGQEDVERQAIDRVNKSIPDPAAIPQPQISQAPQVQAQQQMQPGMLPMQQTVTQNVIDPIALRKQEKASADVTKAIQSKADADIATNTALISEQRARAAYLQQQAEEQESINAQRTEEANQKRAEIEKAVQDRDAFKFNPNRFNERIGVGGQILASIAQGLGAFGAAITHSPNFAQQAIERAINADLSSQEKEYQALGAKVDSRRNDYAAFRQQGMDDDSARTAVRMLKLQQSNAKIDELVAGSKNQQIQAAADEMKALNNQSLANQALEYTKRQVSTIKTNTAASGQQRNLEDQLKLRALEVDVPQVDPKTGKNSGTKTLLAKTPQDAEKVRDALTVSRTIKNNLSRMKKLVQTTSQSISPKSKIEVQKLNDQLATQFGVLNHLGALSDKDYQIASQLGDPTSFFQRDSTTVELINQYEKNLDTMVEGELRGRGLVK